jgi:hypothetical protein
MEKFIENYKQLSIIISIFHNYNTTAIAANAVNAVAQNIKDRGYVDNIEKFIADEYAYILSKYYNYNIILT